MVEGLAEVEKALEDLRSRRMAGGAKAGGGGRGKAAAAEREPSPTDQAEEERLESRRAMLRQTLASLPSGAGSADAGTEAAAIPPGGSIGPNGQILDAQGKPVLGSEGQPLMADPAVVAAMEAAAKEAVAAAEAAAEAVKDNDGQQRRGELVVDLERVVELVSDATPETVEEWKAYLAVALDAMKAAPTSVAVQQMGLCALTCLLGEIERPEAEGGSLERADALREAAMAAGCDLAIEAALAVMPKAALVSGEAALRTIKPKPKPPVKQQTTVIKTGGTNKLAPPPAKPKPKPAEEPPPPPKPEKSYEDEIEVGEGFENFTPEALQRELQRNKQKTLEFFRQIDKDKSGELSKKEFREAVRELGFEIAPKEQIDAVFALLDPDKSGKLSYEELDKGLRKINQERKKAEEQEKKQAKAEAKAAAKKGKK